MALEIITAEATRIAQERLEQDRTREEQRTRKNQEENHRKILATARGVREHELRFQPLQGILTYFSEAIDGVHKEYFPDSPILIIDHYDEGLYYRSLTLVDKNEEEKEKKPKLFTVFAIAEHKAGEDPSYSIAIAYADPDLTSKYGGRDDSEKKKKLELIKDHEGEAVVNLTPAESLFDVGAEGRLDDQDLRTFNIHFDPKEIPLPLAGFKIAYHSETNPIPFAVSQQTTDAVLQTMAKILSSKEYWRLKKLREAEQTPTT